MSINNEQLMAYLRDEFADVKISVSTNRGKIDEALRRLDVISSQTSDLRNTIYDKDGLLEQFTILKTEHCSQMAECEPSIIIARKTLGTEKTAMWISLAAVVVAVGSVVAGLLL